MNHWYHWKPTRRQGPVGQDQHALSQSGGAILTVLFECIHGSEVCDKCVGVGACVHKCGFCAEAQGEETWQTR